MAKHHSTLILILNIIVLVGYLCYIAFHDGTLSSTTARDHWCGAPSLPVPLDALPQRMTFAVNTTACRERLEPHHVWQLQPNSAVLARSITCDRLGRLLWECHCPPTTAVNVLGVRNDALTMVCEGWHGPDDRAYVREGSCYLQYEVALRPYARAPDNHTLGYVGAIRVV